MVAGGGLQSLTCRLVFEVPRVGDGVGVVGVPPWGVVWREEGGHDGYLTRDRREGGSARPPSLGGMAGLSRQAVVVVVVRWRVVVAHGAQAGAGAGAAGACGRRRRRHRHLHPVRRRPGTPQAPGRVLQVMTAADMLDSPGP